MYKVRMEENQKILIGITGCICSGKTSLLNVFESLDAKYMTFSADKFVTYLYQHEESVIKTIIRKFGVTSVTSTSKSNKLNQQAPKIEIDKRKIISLIQTTNNFKILDELWNIVEPYVYKKILELLNSKDKYYKYLVIEIPTIYKTKIMTLCSIIIEVKSNIENIRLRIENRNINNNYSEYYVNKLIDLYKSEMLYQAVSNISNQYDIKIIEFENNINNGFYEKALSLIHDIQISI